MNNKVGILTFHRAHNYGAMLQAYALCKTIQDMNYPCEIIDYRSESIDNVYRKQSIVDLMRKEGVSEGFISFIEYLFHGYYFDIKHLRFKSFLKNNLTVSDKCYTKASQLRHAPYDTYVFGSDQIWNKKITKGFDPVYFGQFVPKNKRKVAYAASTGIMQIKGLDKDRFNKLLKDYYFIGTREIYLKTELINMGLENVECVIDPTLLLSGEKWHNKFIKERPLKEKYILLYQVIKDNHLYEIARKLSKKTGLKIIEIAYKKDITIKDITQKVIYGPKEFLNLIYYSESVITSSFHGTCFSILFHKQFYTYQLKGKDERISSLVRALGLEEQVVKSINDINSSNEIDYISVEAKLSKFRIKAINLLDEALRR